MGRRKFIKRRECGMTLLGQVPRSSIPTTPILKNKFPRNANTHSQRQSKRCRIRGQNLRHQLQSLMSRIHLSKGQRIVLGGICWQWIMGSLSSYLGTFLVVKAKEPKRKRRLLGR